MKYLSKLKSRMNKNSRIFLIYFGYWYDFFLPDYVIFFRPSVIIFFSSRLYLFLIKKDTNEVTLFIKRTKSKCRKIELSPSGNTRNEIGILLINCPVNPHSNWWIWRTNTTSSLVLSALPFSRSYWWHITSMVTSLVNPYDEKSILWRYLC